MAFCFGLFIYFVFSSLLILYRKIWLESSYSKIGKSEKRIMHKNKWKKIESHKLVSLQLSEKMIVSRWNFLTA